MKISYYLWNFLKQSIFKTILSLFMFSNLANNWKKRLKFDLDEFDKSLEAEEGATFFAWPKLYFNKILLQRSVLIQRIIWYNLFFWEFLIFPVIPYWTVKLVHCPVKAHNLFINLNLINSYSKVRSLWCATILII